MRFGFLDIATFVLGVMGILVAIVMLSLLWFWGVHVESQLSFNLLTTLDYEIGSLNSRRYLPRSFDLASRHKSSPVA
jgi:cellobiose-specific phosphotransferase system component IIC